LPAGRGFFFAFGHDASEPGPACYEGWSPEFIAEKGAEKTGVEAKSRHRAGVLQQRGHFDLGANPAPAKIKDLREQALGQHPGNIPFLVFMDVNLPLSRGIAPLDVSADLKRSHSRRSGMSHRAPELASVHTSTRAANR
jgi:hypothetical protein